MYSPYENLMKNFFLRRVLRIRNYSHYVFKGVTTFDSGGKSYFTPQKFRFNPILTLFWLYFNLFCLPWTDTVSSRPDIFRNSSHYVYKRVFIFDNGSGSCFTPQNLRFNLFSTWFQQWKKVETEVLRDKTRSTTIIKHNHSFTHTMRIIPENIRSWTHCIGPGLAKKVEIGSK